MAPIQALTQLLANRQLQNAETATETILKDPESEEQTQTYTYIAAGVIALLLAALGLWLYLRRRKQQKANELSGHFPCCLCIELSSKPADSQAGFLLERDMEPAKLQGSKPKVYKYSPLTANTLHGPRWRWGKGKYRCSRFRCWEQYKAVDAKFPGAMSEIPQEQRGRYTAAKKH